MDSGVWSRFAANLASDFVIGRRLSISPAWNADLERRLTGFRRSLLLTGYRPSSPLRLLATQCFINEYAWREDPDETAAVETLAARSDLGPEDLLRLAMYRLVLPEHVESVEQARKLGGEVRSLTSIEDPTSLAVQQMYEANPYPRWVVHGDVVTQPEVTGNILVAGCGTGRHAILAALKYPNARVLAVDLSRASLGYALRKARDERVPNLDFAHADTLEMPKTGLVFDRIEAVGNLPCMESPTEGLIALAAMLRPGATILLGFYSTAARRGLLAAQELGKTYPKDAAGIRAFRQRIMDDPAFAEVLAWKDFYALSECRDLLLHVREHTHTIPQIEAMLQEAGLTFEAFSRDSERRGLDHWNAVEAAEPRTFRAMYKFTARKA